MISIYRRAPVPPVLQAAFAQRDHLEAELKKFQDETVGSWVLQRFLWKPSRLKPLCAAGPRGIQATLRRQVVERDEALKLQEKDRELNL